MIIPKSFMLYGSKITVEMVDELRHMDDCNGQARYRENTIHIQRPCPQIPRNRDQLETTFCHELVHYLLERSDNEKHEGWLHQDEQLVDRLGMLLHQAINSFEGDLLAAEEEKWAT